eukprot:14461362-Ditylum_brightwellii.AAC.2
MLECNTDYFGFIDINLDTMSQDMRKRMQDATRKRLKTGRSHESNTWGYYRKENNGKKRFYGK